MNAMTSPVTCAASDLRALHPGRSRMKLGKGNDDGRVPHEVAEPDRKLPVDEPKKSQVVKFHRSPRASFFGDRPCRGDALAATHTLPAASPAPPGAKRRQRQRGHRAITDFCDGVVDGPDDYNESHYGRTEKRRAVERNRGHGTS